ncbi:MAG: arginine repressor [Peptostreptococcales bacterium]
MKYSRHAKILDLIKNTEIETQEELAGYLLEAGFDVTQATISRDIKELKLIKIQTPDGKYKYSTDVISNPNETDRYINIFKDTILSVDSSNGLIVIKTLTGCANAACEAIDALHIDSILGTIAGDNTIFIALKDHTNIQQLIKTFRDLKNQKG